MHPPADPPPGLIPIPMKGAVLLLTFQEFQAAVARGKSWRRRIEMARREARITSTVEVPPCQDRSELTS